MTRQEAINKIMKILGDNVRLKMSLAEYIANHIYADVVATAVDDERDAWINVSLVNNDNYEIN